MFDFVDYSLRRRLFRYGTTTVLSFWLLSGGSVQSHVNLLIVAVAQVSARVISKPVLFFIILKASSAIASLIDNLSNVRRKLRVDSNTSGGHFSIISNHVTTLIAR